MAGFASGGRDLGRELEAGFASGGRDLGRELDRRGAGYPWVHLSRKVADAVCAGGTHQWSCSFSEGW
jgi:hypothetical protein